MSNIKIGNCYIGNEAPCFIVAEIGINHNGEVDLAKKMIDAAKDCGVNAVKFQCFKPEEFISDPKVTYTYQSQGKEITESMLDMFNRYTFSVQQWKDIFDHCKSKKIICFVAPQNPSDLDSILKITDLPAIKVGADDLTCLEHLEYYASKKKPLIISAGAAYLSEVEDAVNIIRKTGNEELVVLHCVSLYPAEIEDANLQKMLSIREAFNVVVGFSDHTIGTCAASAAASLGASVIEKHFTLDKTSAGPDHWFSADPKELRQLVEAVRCAEKSLGSPVVEPTPKELEMRKLMRRSIVAAKDIKKDQLITQDLLDIKKPGTGLAPKFTKQVLGRKANVDIKKDELISFDKIC
ncbi:MAG: N-acetylneuraminate synthase family protein [Sedimentisphaerales bacterium]|nr:N-acetylneuraminate synthase family protein [Sedimentisphaerales bacterium]